MRHMYRMKGVTLVELMIAVAILAVIAAVAFPAYNGYTKTARETEGWNNLRSMEVAQEEFFLENNTYFAGATAAALEAASGNLWHAAEAAEADRNFTYSAVINATGYTLTATGKGVKVPATVVLKITK
jgi:type IV pilus assembly protein PilE